MDTEVSLEGTLKVDADDLFGYMESDIQDCVESMLRDHDTSEHVAGEAEDLLRQYLNGASCSLAEKFTKAVGEAMSRLHADDTAATPGDEMETVIRTVVRQELRALLYMGQSRLDVQAKYKRVDGYPWHAGGSDGQ